MTIAMQLLSATREGPSDPMRWARDMMDAAKVTQKDLARAWGVSESSISRWLDGLQATDLSVTRAVAFARLVHQPLTLVLQYLGHDVTGVTDAPQGAQGAQGAQSADLHPPAAPDVSTSLMPGRHPGLFRLKLSIELPARRVAKVIAALEDDEPDGVAA